MRGRCNSSILERNLPDGGATERIYRPRMDDGASLPGEAVWNKAGFYTA